MKLARITISSYSFRKLKKPLGLVLASLIFSNLIAINASFAQTYDGYTLECRVKHFEIQRMLFEARVIKDIISSRENKFLNLSAAQLYGSAFAGAGGALVAAMKANHDIWPLISRDTTRHPLNPEEEKLVRRFDSKLFLLRSGLPGAAIGSVLGLGLFTVAESLQTNQVERLRDLSNEQLLKEYEILLNQVSTKGAEIEKCGRVF